jgi:hypothetical protein
MTKIKDLIQLSLFAKQISEDCEHLVRIGSFSFNESTAFDYSDASEDALKYLNILWKKKLTGYDSVKDSFEVA